MEVDVDKDDGEVAYVCNPGWLNKQADVVVDRRLYKE